MANWNPKKICRFPGCRQSTHERYCRLHPEGPPKTDKRPNSAARGYDYRWRKERAFFLADHPFCVECLKKKINMFAEVVDHIEPHRGNQEKFWNIDNWQSLCMYHHNKKTFEEKKQHGKRQAVG